MAEVAIYQNKTEETNQYMIFTVGSEKYGIDVSYINNTIQMPSITRVPCAPKYFKGIINLRGEIVPVMSLSRRLLSMDREITKDSRIIILELEKNDLMGVIVDSVTEVMTISSGIVEDPSPFLKSDETLVKAVAKVGDDIISLIEVDSLLKSAMAS